MRQAGAAFAASPCVLLNWRRALFLAARNHALHSALVDNVPQHGPSFMPARLDWPSAIGNIILNFGAMDWHLTVFLEKHLPEAKFMAVKNLSFQERAKRVKSVMEKTAEFSRKRSEAKQFFARLEQIRLLRNQIAHGQLAVKMNEKCEIESVALTQSRELGGEPGQAQPLRFNGLVKAMTELGRLLEEFQTLSGDWKTDLDLPLKSAK
jgi:hypothetical protein